MYFAFNSGPIAQMNEEGQGSNGFTASDVVEDVPVDDNDYYSILGVPRDATDKQINISYKKLSLKYQPDRHTDEESNEEAAKRFSSITVAYEVLIDPTRRRQYDLQSDQIPSTNIDSVDVSSLGGLSRVFGAVINKLGIPIPTQVSADIIQTAKDICQNGGIEGGGPPLDPRVIDLPWGWGAENKVDRQAAIYFRLTVDVANSEKGFVVDCRSSNKGKFKLIMFDKDGNVLHQEDAVRGKSQNFTHATFFFTTFNTYRLDDISSTDKTLPPVFQRLESFVLSRKTIDPGQYLVCIYGDNFIGKTNFNIIAVPAKITDIDVKGIEESDQELLEIKKVLDKTKAEYIQAKAAYDAILSKLKLHEEKIHNVLEDREKYYSGFLEGAIKAFSPESKFEETGGMDDQGGDVATDEVANNGSFAGVLGLLGTAATTATSVSANAAQTATAATSWFAKRLSMQIQNIIKPSEECEDSLSSESTAVDNHVEERMVADIHDDVHKEKIVENSSPKNVQNEASTNKPLDSNSSEIAGDSSIAEEETL